MPSRGVAAFARTIAAALAASVVLSHAASAQSARYLGIVERYRRGEHQEAIAALNALPIVEIRQSAAQVQENFLPRRSPAPPRLVEAAVVLHAHAAALAPQWPPPLHDRVQNELIGALASTLRGRSAVAHAGSTPPELAFVRAWYLFNISYYQGHGRLSAARTLLRSAPAQVANHPDMALALGALHETAWTLSREGADVGFSPDLREAERAYRAALLAASNLDEAQLRLGRVLTLLGELEPAGAALTAVRPEAEVEYRYLAHLFEADLRGRHGEVAAAQRHCEKAIALLPRAQTARIALAVLKHNSGDRRGAADDIRRAAGIEMADRVDPWLWYGKGMARRTERYLAAMQDIVKP